MKISIAIASLNYGQFLEACLGSITQQDYTNYEVLIADGGSRDESLSIIRRFCERDPRFRLVSTEDKGQADAIQKALKGASGDIIGFLNADDYLLCRDAFSAIARAFEYYPRVDLVSFTGWYVGEEGHHIKPVRHRFHPLDNISWMKYRPQILQPATFWTKRVATEVPFLTDFHYVFDTLFFLQAYQKFSFLELTKPIVAYRLHISNKSVTVRSARIVELAKLEQMKFGRYSYRAGYLYSVGAMARLCEHLPLIGKIVGRVLHVTVNSLAFVSFYRLPGI
jgi:glycosyltransferase involved in cell wall biosynthesis